MDHFEAVKAALDSVDEALIEELALEIIHHERVQTCGNGGSMATAMHFATDLRSVGIDAHAMCSPSTLTQLMNDEGPGKVFASQARKGVLVIAITGSGTSGDIQRLLYSSAVDIDDLVILTSTMKAGQRAWDTHEALTPFVIEVDSDDYEVIEDVHMAICHAVKKLLRERTRK